MTDFAEKLRHRCRNPKCRTKLPAPVVNEREAFCCRACYEGFHLYRCRVCEAPIKQGRGQKRVVCNKAKCKTAWKAKAGFGRFSPWMGADTILASHSAKSAHLTGIKTGLKIGRAPDKPAVEHWTGTWKVLRVVAGPPITAEQYHGAVVGAGEVLAENERINDAHVRAAEAGKYGYAAKHPAPVLPEPKPIESRVSLERLEHYRRQIPDDLSIPPFLDRRPPPAEQREAA